MNHPWSFYETTHCLLDRSNLGSRAQAEFMPPVPGLGFVAHHFWRVAARHEELFHRLRSPVTGRGRCRPTTGGIAVGFAALLNLQKTWNVSSHISQLSTLHLGQKSRTIPFRKLVLGIIRSPL
jgi:hypothetical protein